MKNALDQLLIVIALWRMWQGEPWNGTLESNSNCKSVAVYQADNGSKRANASRAAAMNRATRARSFRPGWRSTPLATSTPQGRVARTASWMLSGVSPPATRIGLVIPRGASDQSKAQRYAFFSEREAAKIAGVPEGTKPRNVERVAIIGAGTMGGGIAMNFVNAKYGTGNPTIRQFCLVANALALLFWITMAYFLWYKFVRYPFALIPILILGLAFTGSLNDVLQSRKK